MSQSTDTPQGLYFAPSYLCTLLNAYVSRTCREQQEIAKAGVEW